MAPIGPVSCDNCRENEQMGARNGGSRRRDRFIPGGSLAPIVTLPSPRVW